MQNATSRATNKRRAAFKVNLRTPWEKSFAFTSAARRQISPATLRRIMELNAADQALWHLGDALLTQRLAEQRAAGILEELPKPKKEAAPQKTEGVPLVSEEEAGDGAYEEEEDDNAYEEEAPPSRATGADGSADNEDRDGASVDDDESTHVHEEL